MQGRLKTSEEQKRLNKLIGSNIKKYRNLADLSQQELADIVNLTRGTISNYERGKKNIDDRFLGLIANALEVEKQILKN